MSRRKGGNYDDAELVSMTTQKELLDNQKEVFNGLIEDESWEECEQKVRSLFKEKLQLDPKKIEIERAYRNGRFQADARPRPIVAKLLRFKDKEAIIQRVSQLSWQSWEMEQELARCPLWSATCGESYLLTGGRLV
ncbi:hypothetical protein Bbelb_388560 [Branchiostoma belcheri]|nr:hypothetical protein Bbelb_388560 [Branchiostoma belcheri]